jgi:hypothetical protein
LTAANKRIQQLETELAIARRAVELLKEPTDPRGAPSERSSRHAWLTDVIRQVHLDSRGTYGSRRVHAELTLGHGLVVGYEQVTLLMRRAGIQGLSGRPGGSGHRSLSRPLEPKPARARSTARSFSTSTRGGWSDGPSTPRRPPRW